MDDEAGIGHENIFRRKAVDKALHVVGHNFVLQAWTLIRAGNTYQKHAHGFDEVRGLRVRQAEHRYAGLCDEFYARRKKAFCLDQMFERNIVLNQMLQPYEQWHKAVISHRAIMQLSLIHI